MRQTELDKISNKLIKEFGKKAGWKFCGGYLFVKKDSLFFMLLILPQAKNKRLTYTLYYKYYDFDEIFWRIVDLEENIKQPLSFHAKGAWTAPIMSINDGTIENMEWNENNLSEKINEIVLENDNISLDISKKVKTLDENIIYLEEQYANLLRKYPNTVRDIYTEKLLTAVLKKDYWSALQLVNERLDKKDTGGFLVGSKSFYELAKEFIEKFA